MENISLIAGRSIDEAKNILEHFKALLEADRKYLLPIIGALTDFNVANGLMKENMLEISVQALSCVGESDLPTIVRTILSAVDTKNVQTMLEALRNGCV